MKKQDKKRGRPRLLTDDIKKLILFCVSADQKKPPEQRAQRKVLAYQIQQEIIQKLKTRPPELSTLEKEISKCRSRLSEPSKLDELWTIDSLLQHPISPDALPKVFQIWLYEQADPTLPPLTIREARWIAQLSGMTDDIERLRMMAETCAEWELIGELTDTPQLSSPATMFYVYSELIKMNEEEKRKWYEAIRREKHPSVSGPRHEKMMKLLEFVYGKNVLKTVKRKSKSKKGDTQ